MRSFAFPRSTRRTSLLIPASLFACALAVAAEPPPPLEGPEDPLPLGRVFSQTGTPNDGIWGRPGGKTYTYSNVNHADNTDVYWGMETAGVRLSLDGPDYSDPGEIMSFDAAASELPSGFAVWTGQTTIVHINLGPITAYTRFEMRVTEAGTDTPVPLTLATELGLAEDVGGVVAFENSAAAVDINVLFLASDTIDGSYEPHLDYFDPRTGISQDGRANSSLLYGFYWLNTPPFLTANSNNALDEGDSVVITADFLAADDYESADDMITFTVDPESFGGTPQRGTLYRDSVALPSLGTFTQQDLVDGLISYEHDGSETIQDSFTFTVEDEQGELARDGDFTVFKHTFNVSPVNDAPTAIDGSGDAELDGTFAGVFEASDPENDPITFSVVATDVGETQLLNPAAGVFIYAAPDGYVGDAVITFQVFDGGLFAETAGSFTIAVPDPSIARIDQGDLLIGNGDKVILHNLPENTDYVVSQGGSLENIIALDIGGPERVFVLDRTGGLVRIGLEDGTQHIVAGPENFATDGPGNIAVEDDGNVLVANLDFAGTPSLLRVDTETGNVTTLASGDLIPVVTAVTTTEEAVYAADASLFVEGVSKLVSVDPGDGAQTLISQGDLLKVPLGLAIEPGGSILVADAPAGTPVEGPNRVLRVFPDGIQHALSEGDLIATVLADITAGPDGRIFVAGEGTVIEIDPVTGVQSLIPTADIVDRPSELRVIHFREIFADSFESGTEP